MKIEKSFNLQLKINKWKKNTKNVYRLADTDAESDVSGKRTKPNPFTMELCCIGTMKWGTNATDKDFKCASQWHTLKHSNTQTRTQTQTHTHFFGDQLPRDRNLCYIPATTTCGVPVPFPPAAKICHYGICSGRFNKNCVNSLSSFH